MTAQEDIRNLPIDITFSRLGGKMHAIVFCFITFWYHFLIIINLLIIEEWLVDRKRIHADWRKRLAALRARISKAFASLPKDADAYFLTLDVEGKWFSTWLLFSFYVITVRLWLVKIMETIQIFASEAFPILFILGL